jgi:5-(carboxyamino)imidazole ribonucleotide synthase
MSKAILPGATLGMLGGGQLGRMFTSVALEMGYRVIVLDPDHRSPAGQIASEHLCAGYGDHAALEYLAAQCAAISTEFENIPATSLRWLESRVPVRPSSAAVEVAQDRIREKTFIREAGLATARFAAINTPQDISRAWDEIGVEVAILKTARLGYDGKGQAICRSAHEAYEAFAGFDMVPCVLEQRVDLACEVSVVLARSADGEVSCFPVGENVHENGILDITRVPARVDEALALTAIDMATRLATALEYVGVLAVECFVTRGGEVLINEIAPRPHNSGHYTQDATVCSQFEQQLRMMCALPAGDTRLISPVAMLNLLGDLWGDSQPDWTAVLEEAGAQLHLYGKAEARRGRKMGHVNLLADTIEEAGERAEALKAQLVAAASSR